MMHRGQHLLDNFETLCSIHALTVKRYRMVMTKELIALSTEQNEILVVAMAGRVKVDAKSLNDPVTLGEKDILYLPPGDKFNLRSVSSPNDVILAYAPASHSYRPYYKRFSETKVVNAGSDACRRRVYRMIVEKDPAERFLSGFTEGEQGNWTTFPPHKHDGNPELYIYYGMGGRFGVQTVITDEEERAYVVHDGDAVLVEKGFHSNVATPGTGMNFLWIISADRKAGGLSLEFHPNYRDLQIAPIHLGTERC